MDRVFYNRAVTSDKNSMTISRDAKMELQPALHSFLSEKTLPSARNAMNNIKSGEVMKLKDLISYEEGSIANLDVVVPLTEIYQLYGDISGSHTTHLQRGGLLHSGLLFVHRANGKRGFLPAGGITFSLPPKLQDYKGLSTRL